MWICGPWRCGAEGAAPAAAPPLAAGRCLAFVRAMCAYDAVLYMQMSDLLIQTSVNQGYNWSFARGEA